MQNTTPDLPRLMVASLNESQNVAPAGYEYEYVPSGTVNFTRLDNNVYSEAFKNAGPGAMPTKRLVKKQPDTTSSAENNKQ